MRKYSIQNSHVSAFVLKNIFVDHGDVETPARWFSERKRLTFVGKIKLLDSNKERKQNLWHFAEQFNIVKTATAKIFKNESFIRKEYKVFRGKTKGQFPDINEKLCA